MATPQPHRDATGALRVAGLLGALVVAAAARALGSERVFLQDGTVAFAFGDAFYHARRSLYSFVNFPRVLSFDPCINYPDGSVVPHPPLLDWALAGSARAFGDSLERFEQVAAWSPVLLGSLGVLAVYALGATLGRRAAGLGAAWLYALLPIPVLYAQVGNLDHHAAAGLLGGLLVALYAAALDPRRRGRSLAGVLLALALVRAAMLLVWTGSLLYLALGEAALLVAAAAADRRDLLAGQALGSLATLALVAPVVAWLPTPNGGLYSGTELSRLHLLGLCGNAGLCAVLPALERWRPAAAPRKRLLRLGALGAAAGLGVLALPDVRAGVAPAFSFLARSDAYTSHVLEQLPLFWEQGRLSTAAGEMRLGYFAYLVPFVPLAFLFALRGERRGAQGLFLFAWTLLFGYLGLQQMRYAHDLAPAACVGFALALAGTAARVQARFGLRLRTATALAVLGGALLLAPTLPRFYAPQLEIAAAVRHGELEGVDRALLSIGGTQLRFAEAVREATPAAAGCDASDEVPPYGILAHPAIGHVLHYVAQRATPADPFGPYIGRENFESMLRFQRAESQAEALALAERLGTPYVLTAEEVFEASDRSVARRLQQGDGRAHAGLPHLERFRLVTEGPRGGVPISFAFETRRRPAVPYKLFEIVQGAVLRVPAKPGQRVSAEVALLTPAGRRFRFRAEAAAGTDGVARLRVPYANDSGLPTRTLGPYVVRAGERSWAVRVPNDAVLRGATLGLGEQEGGSP